MQDGEPAGDEHRAALDGDARQGAGGVAEVVQLLLRWQAVDKTATAPRSSPGKHGVREGGAAD